MTVQQSDGVYICVDLDEHQRANENSDFLRPVDRLYAMMIRQFGVFSNAPHLRLTAPQKNSPVAG